MYFSFLLVDLGPRATTNESLPKGALKINTLSNQLSPKASNIYLRIGYRKDDKFISVVEGEKYLIQISSLTYKKKKN